MKAFSKQKFLDNVLKEKIRRYHNLARGQINPDFDKDHPDWVSNATQENYTVMDKALKTEFQQNIDRYVNRIRKLDA